MVMRCGTYPAWAAQAGVRLSLTLEADKSASDAKNIVIPDLAWAMFLESDYLFI